MNFQELVSAFRGNRKRRAQEELSNLGKKFAVDANASVDIETIDRVLSGAGASADDLQREVSIHQYRANCRQELASAETKIREAQSARDKANAHLESLTSELQEARRAAVEAQNTLEHLGKRYAGHHRYLRDTAPEGLRQRLAEVGGRLVDLSVQIEGRKRQAKRMENNIAPAGLLHPESPKAKKIRTMVDSEATEIQFLEAEYAGLNKESEQLKAAIINA